MQRVKCEVRLSGDVGNTVLKENVSPAEIVVLTAMHGEGAVVNVQPTHMCKTPHSAERSRLSTTYGHHVVDRLFPGEFSRLPVSLAAISGEAGDEEEEEDHEKESETDEAAAKKEADALRKRLKRAEEKRVAVLASVLAATTVDELKKIASDNKLDIDGENEAVEDLKEAMAELLAPAPAE